MKILLALIVSIPFIANAQETKKSEVNKNISVGFSFSPDYSYRTLKNNDGSSSIDRVIDLRNDIEKSKFGFTTGLNLNIRLSDKVEFQTGLLYSNKGYKTPKHATDFPVPDPSQATHFESEANFNYLDIPLKFDFISGMGKVKFIIGAGFAANILLNNSDKITLSYADGSEKKFDQSDGFDYNKFNISSLVSVGLKYQMKENLFLRMEPTFRYELLKIDDYPVTARLWNLGLNVGVYCNLK